MSCVPFISPDVKTTDPGPLLQFFLVWQRRQTFNMLSHLFLWTILKLRSKQLWDKTAALTHESSLQNVQTDIANPWHWQTELLQVARCCPAVMPSGASSWSPHLLLTAMCARTSVFAYIKSLHQQLCTCHLRRAHLSSASAPPNWKLKRGNVHRTFTIKR